MVAYRMFCALFLAISAACFSHGAVASEFEAPATTTNQRGFSATLTPFSGWIPGIEGTVAGPRASADLSITPIDMLNNIDGLIDVVDGIYIGWGEIRYHKVGLFFDVYYLDISSAATIGKGGVNAGLDVAFRQNTTTWAGTYRVYESGQGHLDAMAGVRISDIDLGIGLRAGPINVALDRGASWTDGIVGMKGQYRIDPKWSVTGWGLIGGGASDITWDLYGALTYNWRPGVDLSVGFRGLKIDYSTADFKWDVLQYGPVVNATVKF